jgi:hypothetical protein
MGNDTANKQPRKPSRPFQFSLRHVLAFILALSVLLSLVTQLKHIGFVIFCFLAGTGVGSWLQKWRLVLASLTGLLVFTTTYLACWVKIGDARHMDVETARGYSVLRLVNESLTRYAKAKGHFPDSLQELAKLKDHGLPVDESGQVVDFRGHPFYYRKTPSGFELANLGRDGKIGGRGLDADVFVGDGPYSAKMHLPLRQFLFEARGSGSMFLPALFASLVAGSVWLDSRQHPLPSGKRLVLAVAVVTVSAAVVATFLAFFYVAESQSGH